MINSCAYESALQPGCYCCVDLVWQKMISFDTVELKLEPKDVDLNLAPPYPELCCVWWTGSFCLTTNVGKAPILGAKNQAYKRRGQWLQIRNEDSDGGARFFCDRQPVTHLLQKPSCWRDTVVESWINSVVKLCMGYFWECSESNGEESNFVKAPKPGSHFQLFLK